MRSKTHNYLIWLRHGLVLGMALAVGVALNSLGRTHNLPQLSTSACTWVTTSCGSGCADNKDLYNCSTSVQVNTVTYSSGNADSNNKAQYVAPAVVTQYIPPQETPTVNGVASVANNAGQQASAGTTYTDSTGQGGAITTSQGANQNQINASNVTAYVAAQNAAVQTNVVNGQTGNYYCAPNSVCQGNVVSGGAPFVVGCDCSGDGRTDRQLAVNSVKGSQAASYCSQVVCSAPGTQVTWNGQTYNKACDPGSQMCTSGGRAQVCNDAGTGYGAAVYSHACGYIGCGNGTGFEQCGVIGDSNHVSHYHASKECTDIGGTLSLVGSNPVVYKCSVPYFRYSSDSSGKTIRTRFLGCQGNQNCYAIETFYPNSASGYTTVKSTQCYFEPGLSCGATKVDSTTPATPITPAGQETVVTQTPSSPTPPPSSPTPPPATSPTPTPTLACIGLSASKAAPQIGDQVSFTCTNVPGADRYEFRYAVDTAAHLASNANFQTLTTQQGQPNVSVPITVNTVAHYFAQCRPCMGNVCDAWEDATTL